MCVGVVKMCARTLDYMRMITQQDLHNNIKRERSGFLCASHTYKHKANILYNIFVRFARVSCVLCALWYMCMFVRMLTIIIHMYCIYSIVYSLCGLRKSIFFQYGPRVEMGYYAPHVKSIYPHDKVIDKITNSFSGGNKCAVKNSIEHVHIKMS